MPFTLSHPAAVLPFLSEGRARGRLAGSALVAGSLAPDVPFFTDSLVHGTFAFGEVTHRWWAVPTVDVVIAAALVVSWHGLLREPLVALLPGRWADAAEELTAPRGRARDAAGAGWFALSAALGAATHVAWDAFTHGGRLGVRLLPVLARTVHGRPVYWLLQCGFSVLGLGVLAWAVPRVLRRARPERGPGPRRGLRLPRRTRASVTALAGAAALAGAGQRLTRWDAGPLRDASVFDLVPTVAFGAGAGVAAALVCYAAAVRLPALRRFAAGGA
ncbi:DUF4184 family protein [Actinacidiphila sp. DG2A-62]|uniref:DUF4184 family protein n=1 Tax=Actinacidiphila sp. DG2A-62 TaxID=3108821 RepID=UPI002DBAA0DF|nr:DUF4184 family protein [Actinacidiphila sp. DG2A-62]MEC3992148.1 DUF4184 family protein [Actinacidiphila sp. DG2A-62]